MTEELPEEVRRGMVRVAVFVGVPAVVVSTAAFLYTEDPYVPVAVMVIASAAMAYEWYDRGYLNEDEWDDI
ncbi:MAG: hypothetical protein ACLFSW_06290 [Halobacteriales archaeon]